MPPTRSLAARELAQHLRGAVELSGKVAALEQGLAEVDSAWTAPARHPA